MDGWIDEWMNKTSLYCMNHHQLIKEMICTAHQLGGACIA
jgi:hypothetical protein